MPIMGLSGLSMFESRFNTQIYAHFGGRLYILAQLCTQRARQDRPTDCRSYNTYCIIIYVYGFPCGRGPRALRQLHFASVPDPIAISNLFSVFVFVSDFNCDFSIWLSSMFGGDSSMRRSWCRRHHLLLSLCC